MFCEHGAILRPIETRDAIKATLEAKDEPVAWIWKYANGEEEVVFIPPRHVDASHVDAPSTITPLYTTPPQRNPLTDEEICPWFQENTALTNEAAMRIVRAIEAKLKEKTHELR